MRDTLQTGPTPGFTFFPHVGTVRIEGPFNAEPAKDSPSRRKIFVCSPTSAADETACARKVITRLATRAFRRPATAADVNALMKFYETGRTDEDFDQGIELALARILASPKFIYRIEAEPAVVKAGQAYRLSDLDLASRLSFFLWSTIPDDELLTVASQGRLKDPVVLERQVRRMLKDPRAEALAVNFAGPVAEPARPAERRPAADAVSGLRRPAAAGDAARSRAAVRQHRPRGSQRRRSADRRLHVRQRAAGQALRHPARLRQPVPPRHARARTWISAAGCSAKARFS